MAKSKLVSPTGLSLQSEPTILNTKSTLGSVPKVKSAKPCNSQVLVEILTEQEMTSSTLYVANNAKSNEAFQGYIKAYGPACKAEEYGFKVGDRVMVSGMCVPVPNFDNSHRQKVLMEPHAIKSVLSES